MCVPGHNPTVEATVVGEGAEAHLLCTSPPLWRRGAWRRGVTTTEKLELSVTLNGQDCNPM